MPEAADIPIAVNAWMVSIADHGWHGASLSDAADRSAIPADDLAAAAGDRHDALAMLVDHALREAFLGAATGGSVRDRLFDGIMRGLDVAQAQRPALLAVVAARDPGVALLIGGRAQRGVRRLADGAGVDLSGVRGLARLAALGGLLAALLRVWAKDDSPDMAGTMAELDRLLERAEKAETDGLSPGLLGLPAFPNPFARVPGSSRDLPPE